MGTELFREKTGYDRPLDVAFVNFTRKWGGVKTWILEYGDALARRGHKVTVVCRPETGFAEACCARGFRTSTISPGPKYNPVAVARVVRIFRRVRPQVAVVNISRDLEVGAVAARLCRTPVLHRVGLVEDFRGRAEERWQHRVLVDRVLVPARWMAEALPVKLPWLSPSSVVTIPNGRRPREFPVATGSGGGEVVFGVASQLSSSKGHRVVLEAVSLLRRAGAPVRLRVAGTGPLEADLRALADRLKIEDSVSWAGFQSDVPGFLGGLDAFVLASSKEGFPNALLEAIFAGLPVVSSDLPGTRELLGGAGLLVPAGDPGALAEAMEKLIGDPASRARFGAAARCRAEEHYDLDANAVAFETLLYGMALR